MSYILLEVTLKERIHPKLWLAEFHPTSAWHGKRLYTLLLSAVCLLDMKGFELFHWKFQDDFLWETLRAFVSYDWTPVIIGCTCILVRYIRSLCGTGGPINWMNSLGFADVSSRLTSLLAPSCLFVDSLCCYLR